MTSNTNNFYNGEIYGGVTGFRLKYPSYSTHRIWSADNLEWIEITKRKNELPTAKLRTYVLYYRNDGDDTQSQQQPGLTEYNYRFYSKEEDGKGKQIGWFWGFPLFKINEDNWPLWNSCLSSTRGFEGSIINNIGEFKYNISFSSENTFTNLDFDKILLNKEVTQQHTSNKVFIYHIDKLGFNIDSSMNIIKSNITSKEYLIKISDLNNNFSTFLITDIIKNNNNEFWELDIKNIKNSGDNLIQENIEISVSFFESQIEGNENMLVDISKNKNMIVLDFSGYSRQPPLKKISASNLTTSAYITPAFNDIRRNFTYQTPSQNIEKVKNFYITLRIKKSTENNLSLHFNPWNGNVRQRNKWCSLVEYVYDCDVIYPTDMLDLMYNKFLYKPSYEQIIRYFGELIEVNNRTYPEGLAPIISNTVNTYTNVLKFQILTGLGPDDSYATLLSNSDEHNAREHTLTIDTFNFVDNKKVYKYDTVKQYNTVTQKNEYMGILKINFIGENITEIVVITEPNKEFVTGEITIGENNINPNVTGQTYSDITMEPFFKEDYYKDWIDNERIMSINQIKNSLVYVDRDLDIYEAPNSLQQASNYNWDGNTHGGNTIVKMIGGFYSNGSDNSLKIGYYGDNYSNYDTTETNNDKKYTKVDLSSNGWRWDLSFNVFDTGNDFNNNLWIENPDSIENKDYHLTYDLNNLLWCSLRSPRKSKQIFKEPIGNANIRYRFITNYLDLSGNDCIGGGYAINNKTIDLPRKSLKPYYSDENNLNTVSIENYQINDIQQYFTDNLERNINESQTFKVGFKLLLPPSKDKHFKIKYTFGQDVSSSVVTFFRFSDMDGNFSNEDKSSKKAVRKEESIELEWNSSSLNNNGEMPIKYMYLTDVASGSSNIEPTFDISDPSLNNINKFEPYLNTNNTTSNLDISKSLYDISCNIFQFTFSENNTNTNVLPFIKEIEENKSYNILLKKIPENYTPYRYLNVESVEGLNTNLQIFDDEFYKQKNLHDISNGPILKLPDGENYSIHLRKVDVKNNSLNSFFIQGKENNISNTELSTINDISFNIISSLYENINGDLIIFKKKDLFDIIINRRILVSKNINLNEDILYFSQPETDNFNNYFIPDYWKLNKNINLIKALNQNNYSYFNSWENQSSIAFGLTYKNISIREKKPNGSLSDSICRYALINSNKERIDSDINTNIEHAFIDSNGVIIPKNNNIVFNFTNSLVNTKLNEKPIVVQFFSNKIFGDTGYKFFGKLNEIDITTGINKPSFTDVNYIDFKPIFIEKLMLERNNFINNNTSLEILNNIHDIGISTWDDETLNIDIQNNYYNNIDRRTNISILVVDISNIVHLNPNPSDMISTNNDSITIKWSGFDFLNISDWNSINLRKSYIDWHVQRVNMETSETITVHSGVLPFNNNYEIIDNNIVLNDTYRYKVTGKFIWEGLKSLIPNIEELPFLTIHGFETTNIFVCKFNRFIDGRFNTTSTNKKLFPNNKNIYSSTADTMTKKQTYVRLLRQKTRPDR